MRYAITLPAFTSWIFRIKKHMKDDALRNADKATVMCASRKTEPLILKGCMPDYSTDIVANKIRKII
jgi:hypothetical protein